MTFVMDASITASWCFADEESVSADFALDRIIQDPAIVPAHWWFELRNVLLVGERRRRIEAAQIVRFLRFVDALQIETDQSADQHTIFDLARRHRLSFYDAAYLELALRYGCLASLDRDLVKAARAEHVGIVEPQ